MNKFQQELLNGGLTLALGGWIWWYAGGFPSLPEGYPGPALFPRVLGIGLIGAGLAILIVAFLHRQRLAGQVAEEGVRRGGLLKMAGGLGLVALYPFVQPLIGFAAALGAVCFLTALLLRAKIWVAALTALGTVLFIHLVFVTLLGLSL